MGLAQKEMGMEKSLYLDAHTGISGDMFLGALLDLGFPLERLRALASELGLSGVEISAFSVERRGLRGTKVRIKTLNRGVVRTYRHIRGIIETSVVGDTIKSRSLEVFRVMAEAESKIHARNLDQIHFHELGGEDTILDVVGTISALEFLKVREVICSPLPLGKGRVRTQHGLLPVPAPAVVEILRGVPVYGGDFTTEVVTPTGAALVKVLCQEFGPLPPMRLESVGYGAGERDLEMPNLLRVLLGVRTRAGDLRAMRLVISANIDDMNPELYPFVMEKLFQAGAEDVWLIPVQMKKSRPAVILNALVDPSDEEMVKGIIFDETKTLGVRITRVEKEYLERESISVDTMYGTVMVKLARRAGKVVNLSPEYEDCRRIAVERGVPLKDVYSEAEKEARKIVLGEGKGEEGEGA